MLPPYARPGLNCSALVGLLAELALVDHPAAPPSFAEGLAQWLGWKEAIPLSAALQGGSPARAAAPAAASASHGGAKLQAAATAAATADYQRVRQAMESAIAHTCSAARDDGASFVPYRRRYFSLQQAMDSAATALRERLRAVVAQHAGAAGARLVALDSALAGALAAREQALLAQLPVLLEKHFSRLRPGANTDTIAPAAWLAHFSHDMQRLMWAEWDLRLQPAQGLLATLRAAHPDTLPS